jgi:hypothetical protein
MVETHAAPFLQRLSEPEARLLELFRLASPEHREGILIVAEAAAAQPPPPPHHPTILPFRRS